MAAHRPNLAASGADLGFAAAAGLCGALGAPWPAALAIVLAHGAAWAILRRAGLAATSPGRKPFIIAISLAVLAGVDFAAYFIGRMLGTN